MKLRSIAGAWSPRRQRAVLAATAGILILAFLLGSLPAWQRTQRNARQIVAREARTASLGEWAVAGFWMEAGARRWQRDQGPVYDRRFPDEKRREQLYLELARVAREVGIEPLSLCEGKQAPTSSAPAAGDDAMADAAAGAAGAGPAMLEGYLPDPARLPSTELTTFPLEARFDTDYARLARFMGGLATIDRALTVRSLNAVPDQGVIHVALEMQYYAQKTD
jgi:hypothetical protein